VCGPTRRHPIPLNGRQTKRVRLPETQRTETRLCAWADMVVPSNSGSTREVREESGWADFAQETVMWAERGSFGPCAQLISSLFSVFVFLLYLNLEFEFKLGNKIGIPFKYPT
jgi:hypothetical protein